MQNDHMRAKYNLNKKSILPLWVLLFVGQN